MHRAVRKYIKKVAVPGVRLFDMCESLENSVRALIQEKGLQARACDGHSLPPPHSSSPFETGPFVAGDGLPYFIESLVCLARG